MRIKKNWILVLGTYDNEYNAEFDSSDSSITSTRTGTATPEYNYLKIRKYKNDSFVSNFPLSLDQKTFLGKGHLTFTTDFDTWNQLSIGFNGSNQDAHVLFDLQFSNSTDFIPLTNHCKYTLSWDLKILDRTQNGNDAKVTNLVLTEGQNTYYWKDVAKIFCPGEDSIFNDIIYPNYIPIILRVGVNPARVYIQTIGGDNYINTSGLRNFAATVLLTSPNSQLYIKYLEYPHESILYIYIDDYNGASLNDFAIDWWGSTHAFEYAIDAQFILFDSMVMESGINKYSFSGQLVEFDGEQYELWEADTDGAPLMILDTSLSVRDIYHKSIGYNWNNRLCPFTAAFDEDGEIYIDTQSQLDSAYSLITIRTYQ